jgi:Mg-chelatase subunit ChlD
MQGPSTLPGQPPKLPLPAWVFSVLIHAAAFGALCYAYHPWQRGATSGKHGSIGIVLSHSASGSDKNADRRLEVRQAIATMEELTAPVLLAANETTEGTKNNSGDVNDSAATSSKSSATQKSSTAKSAGKQTKPGGKTGSRPATSGSRVPSLGSSNYAQVSVFGVEGKGNKFVYVFDRSASMEGPPLAAAKKQLLQSLQSLDSIHQFHIIFFNTKRQSFDISGGGRRIAFATDRNKKLASNFVGGITADGGTDRFAALRDAIAISPDVVFFLTDADDPMSPTELAEIQRVNRNIQAAICVIEFGRKPDPVPNNFLARMAQESGGQYGYVDTTKLH